MCVCVCLVPVIPLISGVEPQDSQSDWRLSSSTSEEGHVIGLLQSGTTISHLLSELDFSSALRRVFDHRLPGKGGLLTLLSPARGRVADIAIRFGTLAASQWNITETRDNLTPFDIPTYLEALIVCKTKINNLLFQRRMERRLTKSGPPGLWRQPL